MNRLKIVVLDDSEDSLFTIVELLRSKDIKDIKEFTSYTELLEHLTKDVHCYIIDYILDGPMNGLDVIRRIIVVDPYCYFIMLSGYNSFEVIYEFNHLVQAGHFVLKGTKDTDKRIIKCLEDRLGYLNIIEYTNNFVGTTGEKIDELRDTLEKLKKDAR